MKLMSMFTIFVVLCCCWNSKLTCYGWIRWRKVRGTVYWTAALDDAKTCAPFIYRLNRAMNSVPLDYSVLPLRFRQSIHHCSLPTQSRYVWTHHSRLLTRLRERKYHTAFVIYVLTLLLAWPFIYIVSQKNKTPNSCSYLRQILTDFCNSFTNTLSRKSAIKGSLEIPPHLKVVATLPCEILVYKNCIDRKHSNGRPGVCVEEQESPAVADKPARRLRKVCTVYVRAVGL